jgi:hypothetical protein
VSGPPPSAVTIPAGGGLPWASGRIGPPSLRGRMRKSDFSGWQRQAQLGDGELAACKTIAKPRRLRLTLPPHHVLRLCGCTNKPNLPTRTRMGAGRMKTPASRRPGRLRQTNPIRPAPAGKRRWLPGPQALPPPGTSAPNKANPFGAIRRASTLWEKSYGELDTQETSAKQSQFPHGPRRPRIGKAANAAGGTHRAKQSQFVPHRPEKAVAGRTGGA